MNRMIRVGMLPAVAMGVVMLAPSVPAAGAPAPSAAVGVVFPVASPVLPGMCQGRSDANMVLNAHANGQPKFILNLETDALGLPSGVLIVGRGADRLYSDQLCRFWQHMPGQEPEGEGHEGGMGEGDEGATIAHVVGLGHLRDGTRVLARADVRQTEEGAVFRVRYRPMGQHGGEEPGHAADASPAGGVPSVEEEWTWVPDHGWAPLDMLKLRTAEPLDE